MPRKHNTGQCRIIGGQWRGRKITFPAQAHLRPTGDRMRETLFNWLQMDIKGANCLDCFAGSGALSFEALSRGAQQATLIEKDRRACQALEETAQRLATPDATIVCGDVFIVLPTLSETFDCVFLDPPFASDYLLQLLELLVTLNCLRSGAKIYCEMPLATALTAIPESLVIQREKVAGNVRYLLLSQEK